MNSLPMQSDELFRLPASGGPSSILCFATDETASGATLCNDAKLPPIQSSQATDRRSIRLGFIAAHRHIGVSQRCELGLELGINAGRVTPCPLPHEPRSRMLSRP